MRSAVVIIWAVILIGLTGCQAATPVTPPALPSVPVPSTSAGMSATPSATTLALPTPLASAASRSQTPVTGRFAADSFVTAVTDDLRVRTKPGVGNESIKLEPLLWRDAPAFVIDGPIAASGYDWYLIAPLGEVDVPVHPEPPRIGWVAAAARDGEPWLAPMPVECFTTPLEWLQFDLVFPPQHLTDLACFGDRTIQFDALLGRSEAGCEIEQPWRVEPPWFDVCQPDSFTIGDPDADGDLAGRALDVTLAPALDRSALPPPGDTVPVVVSGQYDHPAAKGCRAVENYESDDPHPEPELVVLNCRARFVVTSITGAH